MSIFRLVIPDEAVVRDVDHALETAVEAFLALTGGRAWRDKLLSVTVVEGRSAGVNGHCQPGAATRRPAAAAAATALLVDKLAPGFREQFRGAVTPPE